VERKSRGDDFGNVITYSEVIRSYHCKRRNQVLTITIRIFAVILLYYSNGFIVIIIIIINILTIVKLLPLTTILVV